MDVRQLINSRERSLNARLSFLKLALRRSQMGSLKVLVPSYKDQVEDEIKFIQIDLNKIKETRKAALKSVK